jgi:hypothetical protein
MFFEKTTLAFPLEDVDVGTRVEVVVSLSTLDPGEQSRM